MPITSTERAALMRPGTFLTWVTDDAGAARLTLLRRKSRKPVRDVQDLLNRLQQEHGLLEAIEVLRRACRPRVLRSGRQRGLSLDPLIDAGCDPAPVVTVTVSTPAREVVCNP
ncbi:MAG: hypothetical protein JNL73_13870 [Anaerolineales bacterium]|nr:hypothetical protein [Anaerolineales bacterium]